MKRPTSITIIGALFVIGGVLAACGIIYDLFNDHLNINFAVLMIPVGFGLLKGRSSSRRWARFWIGLFSLICAVLLICYPFFSDSYSVAWFDTELEGMWRHVIAICSPVIFLIAGVWMWKALSHPFLNHHNDQEAEQVGDGDAEEAV